MPETTANQLGWPTPTARDLRHSQTGPETQRDVPRREPTNYETRRRVSADRARGTPSTRLRSPNLR